MGSCSTEQDVDWLEVVSVELVEVVELPEVKLSLLCPGLQVLHLLSYLGLLLLEFPIDGVEVTLPLSQLGLLLLDGTFLLMDLVLSLLELELEDVDVLTHDLLLL